MNNSSQKGLAAIVNIYVENIKLIRIPGVRNTRKLPLNYQIILPEHAINIPETRTYLVNVEISLKVPQKILG